MIVMIQITESARFILGLYVMSQSDFSVTVKGQTKIGRQTGKRNGTNRETHDIFTDFIRWYNITQKASVIRQKRESQNGSGKKTCHIFWKTNISYPMICTRTNVYQDVTNVLFSENSACFFFLLLPFWDSSFCHITDETASDRRSQAKVETICEIHLGNRQLSRFCWCRIYIASAVLFSRWLFLNKICLFL